MKPIHFAMLLALGTGACVDSPPPIQLFQAVVPDESCSVSTNAQGIARGSLNLRYYPDEATAGYRIGFVIRSNLTDTPVQVGDVPVSSADPDTVYVSRLDVEYRTSRSIANLDDASVPIYGTFRGESEGGIIVPLFTTEGLQALKAATGTESVEVEVTVRLTGETTTGAEVESNEVVYPLTVFQAEVPGCTSGRFEPSTAACDPRFQNGVVPECDTTP